MVFDERGSYTETSVNLATKVRTVLKDTLLAANEDGMRIEEIMYIVQSEVDKILLMEQVKKRMGYKL